MSVTGANSTAPYIFIVIALFRAKDAMPLRWRGVTTLMQKKISFLFSFVALENYSKSIPFLSFCHIFLQLSIVVLLSKAPFFACARFLIFLLMSMFFSRWTCNFIHCLIRRAETNNQNLNQQENWLKYLRNFHTGFSILSPSAKRNYGDQGLSFHLAWHYLPHLQRTVIGIVICKTVMVWDLAQFWDCSQHSQEFNPCTSH